MRTDRLRLSRSASFLCVSSSAFICAFTLVAAADDPAPSRPGLVRCANLIYGNGQTSKCFADHFLADAQKETNIWTDQRFTPVKLESEELFKFPFAVMSGEASFTFTDAQVENLRRYLSSGGFLVVSPGCSSPLFTASFESEFARVFPGAALEELDMPHPIFATVYDIDELKTKKRGVRAVLKALVIDGRVVLVYSPEGLNDTGNAGGNCCCCGGNEILNARQVNVNLLAYAVTH
jgi:hypothetical protein